MTRPFTLAQAAEARRLIIEEVKMLLSVAAIDVQDLYGDDSLIDVFSVKCDPPSLIHGSHKDTPLARHFATSLVDRLLADPDSGVVLDYDPDAKYARADNGIFSEQAEDPYQSFVKPEVPPMPEPPEELKRLLKHVDLRREPVTVERARESIDLLYDEASQEYEAICYYWDDNADTECEWRTDGSESVCDDAAWEHAKTHATNSKETT